MSCRLRPAWLQSALTEIDQSVKELSQGSPTASQEPDSFALRAEYYYQKRPQLISLLHNLHNRYLHLADRYIQSLRARSSHRRRHSASDLSDIDDPIDSISDAESSLSFERPPHPAAPGLDLLVAQLVVAEVDREVLLADLSGSERARTESSRKAELQGSLLEVLEAERMVLLGENARLGYELAAATEDSRGLALEAAYTRQKAAELARCVVKMRADHRVCVLAGRKIEELQGQVCALEKRNRECYEAMAKREVEKLDVRLDLEMLREENRRLRMGAAVPATGWRTGRQVVARFWERVRRLEWVLTPCGTEVKVK